MPTSLISVNVSRAAWDGQKVTGKPSAPHGIELVKGGFISEGILISIRNHPFETLACLRG